MDPIGILLVLAALVCFTRAVEVAGIRQPWASGEVIGLLVGSGVAVVAFVISQYLQGDHALLVSRLVRQRGVYMSMGFGFFHEGAFCLLLYYVPIYFQVVAGITPSEAGFRNLPMLISCGIGSALTGFLVSRFGYYTPFMVWASGGGCVGAGLVYTLDETSPPAKWIGYQVLAGLAFGSGLPLGIIAGQADAEPEDLPSRTAMLLCKSTPPSSSWPYTSIHRRCCRSLTLSLRTAQPHSVLARQLLWEAGSQFSATSFLTSSLALPLASIPLQSSTRALRTFGMCSLPIPCRVSYKRICMPCALSLL